MELADVQAHALSSPINPPQERPFHGGVRRLNKRDFVLVVVETTDGEVGYAPAGASASAMREYFEGASQAAFADLLSERVGAELTGVHLEEVTDAHRIICDLDLPPVLKSQAIAAVDVALHDIRGKRLGTPIYELLSDDGASPTTTLDLYASAGMYMNPEEYAEQAATLRECDFFGYKYRPGIGPDGDRETFERLLEVSGDMMVMADAHLWWKLRDGYGDDVVRDIVTEWADDAYWVEEPVAPDDYAGLVELAKTGAALAGGESEESSAGLVELAETGALLFLQGDVRHHEGYTGCLRAVEHCRGRDVQYVPHHFGTLLGLVANAHLVAGAAEGRLLEYPVFENDPYLDSNSDPGMYPFELAFDILEDELDVEGGQMTVPSGPGLGVDINMKVVERYPFVEGPWTEFVYDE